MTNSKNVTNLSIIKNTKKKDSKYAAQVISSWAERYISMVSDN